MGIPFIIFRQTAIMILYMACGYVLYRGGKITAKGSSELATLLLWLIIPAVIIDSFCIQFTIEKAIRLIFSTGLGSLTIAASIVIARLFYPDAPIERFSACFSNAGFIGIPLVQAALGSDAVFDLIGIIAMLNFLQWTYGRYILLKGTAKWKTVDLILHPIPIGIAIGLVLFLTGVGIKLPAVITTTIHGIANLNTPLAMIVLGVYLAQTGIKSLFTDKRLYLVCAVRLLVIPLAVLTIFLIVPGDVKVKSAVLIAASSPVGANVAVYAQLMSLDYTYACKCGTLSTLLSAITIPVVFTIFGNISIIGI